MELERENENEDNYYVDLCDSFVQNINNLSDPRMLIPLMNNQENSHARGPVRRFFDEGRRFIRYCVTTTWGTHIHVLYRHLQDNNVYALYLRPGGQGINITGSLLTQDLLVSIFAVYTDGIMTTPDMPYYHQ